MCGEDYGSYNSFENRLITFTNWNGNLQPTELALAGFFYKNYHDLTECYYCGIEIHKWQKHDIAINEHLKYSSGCLYAKLIAKMIEEDCRMKERIGNLEQNEKNSRIMLIIFYILFSFFIYMLINK